MDELIASELLADMSEDELLRQIIAVKKQLKHLDELKTVLLDELTRRVEIGDLIYTFSFDDFSFTQCNGKKKWVYPASVNTLQKSLKAAQKTAQANGSAKFTTGASYWTIKHIADESTESDESDES